MIEIRPGVVIPDAALAWRTSRAGGPGGQHVNTTDTRVELLVDLGACGDVLYERTRARLRELAGNRISNDGVLRIVCGTHRSQHRNRRECEERLRELVLEAMRPPPPPRKKTRPSRAARQRRLTAKKQRGETKAARTRKWNKED